MKEPILFIIFNRPNQTFQVFEAIKKYMPERLFIAADGPRLNKSGEIEICKALRNELLESINWPCEVNTLFRDINLGCGKAVSSAISWFFTNVEQGIILEDDCLPADSFFDYASILLNKYKDNHKIFHIAGHNPIDKINGKYSYYFTPIQHCWGWASWRRAWLNYSYDISDLNIFLQTKQIKKIFKKRIVQNYWVTVFKKMENHIIDTWDYQWTYSIFKNSGICIIPAKNQITNIGFDANATHTINENSFFNNQARYEMNEIIHNPKIKFTQSIINKIIKVSYDLSSKNIFARLVKKIVKIITN